MDQAQRLDADGSFYLSASNTCVKVSAANCIESFCVRTWILRKRRWQKRRYEKAATRKSNGNRGLGKTK